MTIFLEGFTPYREEGLCTSASSSVVQDLEPNWQLPGKMSLFNESLGSSMHSFSLTLNVEP